MVLLFVKQMTLHFILLLLQVRRQPVTVQSAIAATSGFNSRCQYTAAAATAAACACISLLLTAPCHCNCCACCPQSGNSVCVFVHGFEPYFYCDCPPMWTPEDCQELCNSLRVSIAELLAQKQQRMANSDLFLLERCAFWQHNNFLVRIPQC